MTRSRKSTSSFITGIEEVDAAFKDIPLSLQKKGCRKGTRAAAKAVLLAAYKYVPVKTGALRKSLKVRAQKRFRDKRRKDWVGALVQTVDGMFKGDQFYGGFLEFGTKERITKAGHPTGRIDRDEWNYLRQALYENRSVKLAAFEAEVTKWLREYLATHKVT
jgi:HK97 gp10 family phage protein